MFDDKSTLIEAASGNPMRIASLALTEIENRLGGTKIIADPNSAFCHLLEFGSSVSASVINMMDEKLPTIYPKRAESMEDLYNHMSDFDYLSMYSTPSRTMLRLTMAKKFLINNAVKYNENYKLLRIPANTVFMLGKYPFGIYYPINILINSYTNTFTVIYDTGETNPLHELSTNVIEKYDTSYRGLDYLIIDFPIYQFAKSTVEESLVAEAGFTKRINYNNDFYALRLFSYKNGKYTELSQSQSKMVYDATVPTAIIRVLPDDKKIKITIPQIYFDKDMLGSKLLIEVYTTLGELEINTSNITDANIGVTYTVGEREDGTYSAIFKNLPFDNILTLSSDLITGGSNALTVSELRDRVVNNTLYDRVPITEGEIANYMKDNGFYIKKYLDNVTDRQYHAYRVIRDSSGSVIPSLTVPLQLKVSYATDQQHSPYLYHNADNSITILPTALYEFDSDTGAAVPLTDDELDNLNNLTKSELASTLNTNQYLKTPFHLRVSVNDQYPQVTSYDLYTNSVDKVIFDEDNYEMAEKMMTFSASVSHSTVGKYTVNMTVFKSDEVASLPESAIKIYIAVLSNAGNWIGTEAEYVRDNTVTGRTEYKFDIPTNYHLTLDNEIGVNFPESYSGDLIQEQLINLTHDFYVVFMIDRTNVSSTLKEPSANIVRGVPESLTTMYVALSRQHLTITLGSSLSDVIRNDVEVSSTLTKYATYSSDIAKKYDEDVYEYDENGVLKYHDDGAGNLNLILLHQAGDEVVDEDGNTVYLHKKGDIIYEGGNPVVDTNRDNLYYISAMFMDAKVFFSDRVSETEFVTSMYSTLEGYFDSIRNIQDQLLERTNLFFRCVRSTGIANINRGDGVADKQNIEMSFKIVCYVPSYVKQSETIQDQITEMTCSAIEDAIDSRTISMLDIFTEVKSKMSDYIDHFDLLGVNNDTTLQTFVITDEDSQPSVARKLELTDDNVLSLNKQIEIQYVALNSNTDDVSDYLTE